jgi:hypothetical protein
MLTLLFCRIVGLNFKPNKKPGNCGVVSYPPLSRVAVYCNSRRVSLHFITEFGATACELVKAVLLMTKRCIGSHGIRLLSVPAPRKERVLPVSDPAIAASREAQAVAANSNGGVEWLWQVETRFSRLGRRRYKPAGLEWRPPVKEAHRSVRNGFRKGCQEQQCQQRAHPG